MRFVVAAALAGSLAVAAPASAADWTLFENPRGNIGCAISKSGARCDVRKREWEPPPKPDWCEVDWGNGLEVGRRGQARFTCAGDTVLGANKVVGYRKSIRRGRFRCTVHRNGTRCVNLRNDHGFKVARRFARWF
jgi:Family of unknown function (DUF6636)